MNTLKGAEKVDTYPRKSSLLPNEALHDTTVDYQKSIVNDKVYALYTIEVVPDL